MKTKEDILQGQDLTDFLLECRLDFKFFCEHVLKGTVGDDFELQPFHVEWADMFKNNPRTCVLAARGLGKSTILGVAFPLWIALFNSHKKIMIVSNTHDQAKDIIKRIRSYIEENEMLRSLMPNESHMVWTKTELNTSSGCQIFSKPYSDNSRGKEADYLLMDEASTYIDTELFFSVYVPIAAKVKGNIMVIGTPISKIDLIAQLERNNSYIVKKYPVVNNGKSIWEEKYPIKQLPELRHEIGDQKFRREMLVEINDESTQPLPYNIILKCFDDNVSFINHGIETLSNDETNTRSYYVGADFALSPKGDWSVFTVIEVGSDKKIKIVEMQRYRGLFYKEQEARLISMNERFKPNRIYVDETTFGKMLFTELKAAGLPIVGYSFTLNNRNTLITNLIRLFQEGRVVIPRHPDDSRALTLTNQLVKELVNMTETETKSGQTTYKSTMRFDDCVISLGLACMAANTTKRFMDFIGIGDPSTSSKAGNSSIYAKFMRD